MQEQARLDAGKVHLKYCGGGGMRCDNTQTTNEYAYSTNDELHSFRGAMQAPTRTSHRENSLPDQALGNGAS